MTTIRSKFQLVEIRQHSWSTEFRTLVFEARYDSSVPEDQRFCTATPTGRFEMLVDNPTALAHFTLGRYYYFDATEVPSGA